MKSRAYCLTINNYVETDERQLADLGRSIPGCYVIYGRETGESGTPHLQVYLRFGNARSFDTIKKLFPRAHIEIARGSPQDNITYCSKDGAFEEYGRRPSQGSRSDLEEIKVSLDNGTAMADIAEQHFGQFCRYHKGFQRYLELMLEKRDKPVPVVIYIHGKTGTGKTRYVYDKEADLWTYPGKGWFDGYTGQKAALFDDFRADDGISFGFILRLLDRYRLRVPVKGGHVPWVPERIYITSNKAPKDIWGGWMTSEELAPFLRRITETIIK